MVVDLESVTLLVQILRWTSWSQSSRTHDANVCWKWQ